MSFGYQKRRPLTEEEKSSDVAKARARALETLAAQEVSSGQLYERLCRRFTEQAAAEVVAEMVQREYVNDERYAEARAHSLLAARKSRRAAARNLRQKGLSAQQVEQRWRRSTPRMKRVRTRSFLLPWRWWRAATARSLPWAGATWLWRPCSGAVLRMRS